MQKLFSTVLVAFIALAGGALAQTFTLTDTLLNQAAGETFLFGTAVATVGNKVLVGAPGNDNGGAAYLFDGNTVLPFSNPTSGLFDEFGRAVAAVGNNVLIGAPGANGGVGAAYLFDGSTGGAPLVTFTNPDATSPENLGFSVAAVGNDVLIGARFGNGGTGAAYLFDATGRMIRTFTLPSLTAQDQFGFSVAAVGNNVLIGAPGDDSITKGTDAGAAYLFDGSNGDSLHTFLNPSTTSTASDRFGTSIAVAGNYILIGAPSRESGSLGSSGAAYLFDATTHASIREYSNPSAASSDQFSASVTAFGSNVLLAIGAPRDDDTGVSDAGQVYLYDPSINSTVPLQELNQSPNANAIALFGNAVAGGGSYIAVAAPGADAGAGAVYLFSSDQPNQPPVANAGPDQTVECASVVETLVTLDGSGSSDPENDPLLYTWSENDAVIAGPTTSATSQVTLALGSHNIALTVKDGNDGTHTDYVMIKVADTAPPTITLVAPITLWPANRKYITLSVAQCVASASDGCAGSISVGQVKIASVSSDEPDDTIDNDIVIADDCQSLELRAERDKQGNGRVYTINLTVMDPSGNVATACYKVSVPTGMNVAAADDGPDHTVLGNCPTGSTPALAATLGKQNIAGIARKEAAEAYQPEGYALLQNHPNPFNPETEIRFALPEASHAVVKIYSMLGEDVRTLADADFSAGTHVVRWNARNDRGERVPSGVYFYQLITPSFSRTMRMILAR